MKHDQVKLAIIECLEEISDGLTSEADALEHGRVEHDFQSIEEYIRNVIVEDAILSLKNTLGGL